MSTYGITERTKVKRLKDRAVYDRNAVHAILDEAFVAHVAYVKDDQPIVLPMGYARVGETLYLHGSITNAMLKTMKVLDPKGGVNVCFTVTLTDGIVVARSAFHHSLNYRSVVVLGKAQPVQDPDEKVAALEAITEHILPGRTSEVRKNSSKEVSATLVLALELNEVSAKIRTGFSKDEPQDYELKDVWAGILPFEPLRAKPPVHDEKLLDGIPAPASITQYRRPVKKD